MSPRRHRDRDRRPRGRRDRGGRERLQEAPAVERRRTAGGLPQDAGSRRSRRSARPSSSRSSSSRSRSCRCSRSWTRKGASSSRSRTRRTFAMAIAAMPRHHARPGDPDALRADGRFRSARSGSRGSSTRSRSGSTTPRRSTRSASSCTGSTSRRAASSCGVRRRRSRSPSSRWSPTVPVYLKLGSRVHAAAQRGPILYMPTTLPGHLGDGGGAAAPDAGPDPDVLPGGRTRVRQGRARRDLDRSGAALDDGDDGPAEAGERVADEGPLVLGLGAAAGSPASCATSGGTASRTTSSSTRWTGRCRSPGRTNAWTMPIKNRIDMLSTGVRTPVGIKVFGADLEEIERIGARGRGGASKAVPGTRSVFAERVAGGYFLDFDLDRDALARYGLHASTTRTTVIVTAIGGEPVTTTDRGPRALLRQRPLPARAARGPRPARAASSCATTAGAQVPLGAARRHPQLARARR